MLSKTFTNVLFCTKVEIIRNDIKFFGFYQCVNSGESLTNWALFSLWGIRRSLHINKTQKLNFIPNHIIYIGIYINATVVIIIFGNVVNLACYNAVRK